MYSRYLPELQYVLKVFSSSSDSMQDGLAGGIEPEEM